ncbi:glycine C-acetyltransferase [Bremerella cremea]|uniref:2-amino-3-ketobutyrate coenzyme A ligase n=1 Tax=Blastopirellula marina TaxID=124 RepID=A0A2S8F912_9BACT|nr:MULTISPECIES: glycine C-acetyltransferase [Pirellulaceae]PQO28635.1 glycine C-acetyltransferase [Blastopirellula marina]RCS42007.1 glycine C-acetyltransferase [Bremerella cremea]
MWNSETQSQYTSILNDIKEAGLYKNERTILSPQKSKIDLPQQTEVLNMCANNYLGLSDHPEIIAAAKEGLDRWGYGLSSVRFICGTQAAHEQLEDEISKFLGMEDTILYSSCFDANGGLFETILGPEDAILSDELNHASIIDGVRLCKAKRFRYKNNDMSDLEEKLKEAKDARVRLIATDGVFSMDGYICNLPDLCDLADKYNAMVMVDDSHAVGFMGKTGRGTHEHHEVIERIDIITGTLGKALGGASGGYTSGRKEIVDLLRQRSRPYLFSNTLAPPIVSGSLKALELIQGSTALRDKLETNTKFFREEIAKLGLDVLPGEHPIVPVMFYDAKVAADFSERLLKRGIYVIGFSYPVVPQGKARIRTQVSAGHSIEELKFAVEQFAAVKQELGL